MPESSRLEFLEKVSASKFALSDAEDNTPRLLNRGSIADLLLLGTLLAICQKPLESSFWKVIYLLFYQHSKVWQLEEPFYNNYQPVLTFLQIEKFCWYKKSNYSLSQLTKLIFYNYLLILALTYNIIHSINLLNLYYSLLTSQLS